MNFRDTTDGIYGPNLVVWDGPHGRNDTNAFGRKYSYVVGSSDLSDPVMLTVFTDTVDALTQSIPGQP